MKAVLVRVEEKTYWFGDDGNKRIGAPTRVHGDLCGVSGDITHVYGCLDGVYGDPSGVSGNLTGIYGDLTGVYGSLDNAEISDAERKKGVSIDDLIKKDDQS